MSNRLAMASQLVQDLTAMPEYFAGVGKQPSRPVQIIQRLFKVIGPIASCPAKSECMIVIRLRLQCFGEEINHCVVVGQSCCLLASSRAQITAVDVSEGMARITSDGFVKSREGRHVISQMEQSDGSIVVRFSRCRIKRQRAIVIFDGLHIAVEPVPR